MERVCDELEEAKTEIEKLKEEIKTKSVLAETLKRAHNEQLAKIQEANARVEKKACELSEKEDEICATKQMYEEIKSIVKEKECLIKHLSSTNDKLRISSNEMLTKWKDEKKEILEKLDDANSNNVEKEQELTTYKEEIKGLKSLLSAFESKCLEAEKSARALKESGQRDNMFSKLEEESRKVEHQLKWKKEQFKHLEEAHEKLRGEFKVSEKQREMEKSALINEMYKLQDKLDSQIRISDDLQSRLQMCHQALAHEESRRKILEVQFSETKIHFDSVLSECEEAKMEIETLTGHRDKEIANMRDLLGQKEMICKEMEYRVGRLEQENQDLRISVKEFQEAQIQEKGGASSSLLKLQNKLKRLEQTHKDCSKNLIAKEAEWASKLENMDENLLSYKTELEKKNEVIKEFEIKCEVLDRIHQDCSEILRAKEVQWASQLEKAVEDLTDCRSELERKDEVIRKLDVTCEGLDRAHRDCSVKLQSEEAQWTSQLDLMAEKVSNYKKELEGKDEVIRELRIKCESLDQVHRDCSSKIRSSEAQWTAQLENMARDLTNCRTELEGKDEIIRELEIKFEALDLVHRDCSSKLKLDKDQWTTQLQNMAEELNKCKTELEARFEAIKELENKCEALDQVHRDCSTKLRAKEAEWTLQMEKLTEDLVECRSALESKDEDIKELRVKMEILDEMYRSCSTILKVKEVEWSSQLEDLARDLTDCKYELECKNDVVNQLEAEFEVLKQNNEDLSAKLLAKEAEWGPQLERMADNLAESRSEIQGKDEVMKELQMALEDSISSSIILEFQNEEKSLMLIVFKSVIFDMNRKIGEMEQEVSLLMKQLELKSETLLREQKCIEGNDENVASLLNKLESLSHLKDKLETDFDKVCNALNKANEDLAEKLCEENEHELELYVWRSLAERLSSDLEELRNLRKDLEASLLRQIEVEDSLKHEKENLVNAVEEKDKFIACLEQELKASETESSDEKEKAFARYREEIECLEQEWLSRELEGVIVAHMNAERVIEQEKEDFRRIVREKDRRIGRKQEELNMLLKAWEKIATDELAKEVEIQEKTLVIAELEGDLEILQRKFDSQQKDLFSAKKDFASEISSKGEEIKDLKSNSRNLEIAIEKLESEKRSLFEDVNKLLSERGGMLDFIGSFSERMSSLSVEDTKLASFWERIVQNCANEDNELHNPSKENMSMNSPLVRKSVEAIVDGRSPLRALNIS